MQVTCAASDWRCRDLLDSAALADSLQGIGGVGLPVGGGGGGGGGDGSSRVTSYSPMRDPGAKGAPVMSDLVRPSCSACPGVRSPPSLSPAPQAPRFDLDTMAKKTEFGNDLAGGAFSGLESMQKRE
jgi:hypothetical protein